MQMTARLRAWTRRAAGVRRTIGTRHLALASAALLLGQCAPQCTPAPAPPAPSPAPAGYFGWVGLGGTLPDEAACAAAVRRAPEVRSSNRSANAARGSASIGQWPRVTGNFSGSTDEIIQWAACKWGFDEDTLRAQAAKESWWHQGAVGDNGESFGLLQVRQPYYPAGTFPNAERSTAFNIDVYLQTWRDCFDGKDTWLNQVDRGAQYGPGDAWGCIGKHFAGRWYTPPAREYIAAVQDYLNRRIWTTSDFLNWRP